MPTLYTVDEYEPFVVDALLVNDSAVFAFTFADDRLRVVPLDKVNHVDGDPATFRAALDLFGGVQYGFASDDALATLEDYEK